MYSKEWYKRDMLQRIYCSSSSSFCQMRALDTTPSSPRSCSTFWLRISSAVISYQLGLPILLLINSSHNRISHIWRQWLLLWMEHSILIFTKFTPLLKLLNHVFHAWYSNSVAISTAATHQDALICILRYDLSVLFEKIYSRSARLWCTP